MTTSVLLELYRHNTWATLRLIELCQRVDDGRLLDTQLPGAFGTVRQTLRHLVGAEEHYFWTVTGERRSEPPGERTVPLDELAERIRRLADGWQRLAADTAATDRELVTRDGWRIRGWTPMAQAVHHAESHRTQVLSMLGAQGLEVPELSVWDYAEATDRMHPVAPSPGG